MLSFPILPTSVDVMARTLWGEARGCGEDGMWHVANVIINRANHPRWWGSDILSVCQAPSQFSCWNKSDPNRAKLLAVTQDNKQFADAVRLATVAIAGKLPDQTGGADSYYARSMARPPAWANRSKETFRDPWHVFLRVELPLPGTNTPAAPTMRAADLESAITDALNAASLAKAKGH